MLRMSFVRHVSRVSVVLFLMTCLKAEVAQAETSLLVAAASCPLYGRAHCITAALQQLSTGYSSTLLYTKLAKCIYHCILSHYYTSSKWLCVCVDLSSCRLNGARLCQTSLLCATGCLTWFPLSSRAPPLRVLSQWTLTLVSIPDALIYILSLKHNECIYIYIYMSC